MPRISISISMPVFRAVIQLAILMSVVGCMVPSRRSGMAAFRLQSGIVRSTVKIHTTMQADSFHQPWQASRPVQGSGSGFVIERKRILTNAHVVSNSRFLEVQKNGDSRRYAARVLFVAHDCDLAILDVDDPRFYDGMEPVLLAGPLPRLGDTVTAVGFPVGGSRVSITRGVVSRIDHGVYAHSAVDRHLVLQVDAAINPGNSGGPVVLDGRAVGVAFQGLSRGDNIGYAIPVPVIRHFLEDIEDGVYDGYPEFGMQYLELRNAALRSGLGLPSAETGVVVNWLDPYGSAAGHLLPRDVLLRIDGQDIAEDGTLLLDGHPVEFTELLERRQAGDDIVLSVFRGGRALTLTVPLIPASDPFTFRNLYDVKPEYAVVGGLVFTPLNREILKSVRGGFRASGEQRFLYLSRYAKTDGHYLDHDEFIILLRRLPHPVNTHTDGFLNGLVASVNGHAIRNLRELIDRLESPVAGFHVIRFADTEDLLVLDAAAAEASRQAILEQYGVPSAYHLNDRVEVLP